MDLACDSPRACIYRQHTHAYAHTYHLADSACGLGMIKGRGRGGLGECLNGLTEFLPPP